MLIQICAPTSNAEEAEFQWFCEDLQDLELTPKERYPFLYMGLECKIRSQEILGVTGKFGLGIQNETGQKLTDFCQEKALVIANTLFQQKKKSLHTDITRWSIPKSD